MLNEDYYLTNFTSLVTFVEKTYRGVLSDAELRWFAAFMSMSEPAMRLYVRLVSRRGNLFRMSKVRYPEIDSIEAAAQELVTHGLALSESPENIEVLIGAFTKPELIKLLDLQGNRSLSRADLEQFIVDRNQASDITILQCADTWLNVSGLEEFTVFKLCFFGNCYQDMSEYVLRDLGIFQYEPYQINKKSRVFQSREQIEAHLQYFHCSSAFAEIDQSDANALLEIDQALPLQKEHDAHLNRRVDRMRNSIARQLERLGCMEDALALYQQSKRPPSRERQVRILMKLERHEKAYALCDSILAKPYTSEETQFVETIQPKLFKLLDMPAPKQSRFKPLTTKLTLSAGEARVEFIARDFYTQFGECFYAENTLFNGVLGLFIWDIIFSPVEGVFYNPFQSAPADFYQPEFVTSREKLLEERFIELNDPLRFSARVWERYEASHGIANPLVSWKYLNKELLSLALIKIPVEDWKKIFSRMLVDLRNHTSGFPDLILFPREGAYELLEIKGPGDTVQKNQKRWMAYFTDARIPYRVVHISWAKQT